MAAILLTRDLACSSQVGGAALAAGVTLHTAMSEARLLEDAAGARVVILDLDSLRMDVEELVSQLRRLEPPPGGIVAFGSHVHAAELAAARQAGCDEVLTRGQFYSRMREVVSRDG